MLVAFGIILIVSVFFVIRHWWPNGSDRSTGEETSIVDTLEGVRFWSAEDIARRQESGEKFVFLDLRSREAFVAEHILEARWFPPEELDRFTPEAGATYILVIERDLPASTIRAVHDAIEARRAGFAFLQGGLEGWRTIGRSIVSSGDPNSFIDQSKVTFVTPEKADEILRTPGEITLLDVREANAFESTHLPSAINIPFALLESRRLELPSGRPIIVYGATEFDGFQAGVRLFDMHFFGVRVIEGGFARWREKNLPIVK